MLAGAAHKNVDGGHNAAQGVRRAGGMHCDHTFDKAGLAELCLRFVFCFDDAVRENNEQITRPQHELTLLVAAGGHDAERQASCFKPLNGTRAPLEKRRVMSGIDVSEGVHRRVPLGEECGGETRSPEAVRRGVAIEPEDQFTQAERRDG